MTYLDGFVIPVPSGAREAYRALAEKAAAAFMRHGALRVVESWGDDVPHGKVTDFYRAVAAGEEESVVFSWVLWPSRAARDAGNARFMADPEMQPGPDMPFDMKRLIFGGFEVIIDRAAEGGEEKE
jgi:uncharacterized protein YbaA (DUF1428 family)